MGLASVPFAVVEHSKSNAIPGERRRWSARLARACVALDMSVSRGLPGTESSSSGFDTGPDATQGSLDAFLSRGALVIEMALPGAFLKFKGPRFMMNAPHAWFWVVSIVLVEAAVIDGLKLRCPNWLTFHLILGGLLFAAWTQGAAGFLWQSRGRHSAWPSL